MFGCHKNKFRCMSLTSAMIPFQATIALNTLLPFSHRFFTQYTIVAYGSHSCSHVVVLR